MIENLTDLDVDVRLRILSLEFSQNWCEGTDAGDNTVIDLADKYFKFLVKGEIPETPSATIIEFPKKN